MSLKLENVRPMLAVTSIDDTIAFYRNVLGFECISRMDGWAALRKGCVEIMISLPNEHEPFDKPTLTGSIYFNASDVDALWGQVKDRARIVYPLENFYYGMREFAIRDNNGYILQFGQEIKDPSQIPPPEID
ncbi:MAG: VOC family protein [Candidatus Angelobacter sp.]